MQHLTRFPVVKWDGNMIELGGCAPGQTTVIAVPPDKAWAYLECGSEEQALNTCKVKTGCTCEVKMKVNESRLDGRYPPC
jgi:hypothetical protein